jgi:hypothetical protein
LSRPIGTDAAAPGQTAGDSRRPDQQRSSNAGAAQLEQFSARCRHSDSTKLLGVEILKLPASQKHADHRQALHERHPC